MSALRQPTPPDDPPSVAVLPTTSPEVLSTIKEAYSFLNARNEAETLNILEKRPDVSTLLLEALPHVREFFGADTQILLIATDHHDGHSTTISARIDAGGTISERMARQDDFFRGWWLNAGDNVLGDLTFGV